MSRRRKPPRLWQRRDGAWLILDGGRQIRTGHRHGERGEAERALADYIRRRAPTRIGPADPAEITVGEIIARYLEDRAENVHDGERLLNAAKALSPFWGDLSVASITGGVCRRYARQRNRAESTIRRELGFLSSALAHAYREGLLLNAPGVWLPAKTPPRERWLTREEVRALLRASAPHLRRFIVIALTTGRRKEAILSLRWTPSTDAGWIDIGSGRIRFSGMRRYETSKRRGEVPMPRRLRFHASIWARDGGSHVITHRGAHVRSIKRAWGAACERAGLEDVRPHDLKRTAVTWAFQRGMAMEDATAFFQTTAATLESVYRQHSPEAHARALEIMDRRL